VSAALKQKAPVTPAPFTSAERARLAAAIVEPAGDDARKAALFKACATADEEVRLARRGVEAADEAIEIAKSNAARHLTDVARGTAGAPPQTIREARASGDRGCRSPGFLSRRAGGVEVRTDRGR
jgi:hypothetical protein